MDKPEVKRFKTEEGQELWKSQFEDKRSGDTMTVFSGALDVTQRETDLTTLFETKSRKIVWLKTTESEERLNVLLGQIQKRIESGELVAIREYSEERFWDGDEMDTDAEGNSLGRYSRVCLCAKEEVASRDRKFVTPKPAVAQEPLKEPEMKVSSGTTEEKGN